MAIAEAITWALLLTGMFLKYVTETTELGVRDLRRWRTAIVFIAYCLDDACVVAVDQRWSRGRLLGLAASVPPFVTMRVRQVRRAPRRARHAAGGWWPRLAQAGRAVGSAWLLRHPVAEAPWPPSPAWPH